ncbi:hypothetical protein EV426DRAFT_631497 [Tirmania nivea]|nr:hypothetical protein EV426DRAFT_631497 [Tirmania nivea]
MSSPLSSSEGAVEVGEVGLYRIPLLPLSLLLSPYCLSLALFLSALETTIVATALIEISEALKRFLIVYAKLSDIFGKKNMLLLGCLGASGIYSMVSVIMPTIVSIKDVAKYDTDFKLFVLSSVLGPVVGGAITDEAHWRWVFWINVYQAVSRIDIGGTVLSLVFSILLVFALEEGGVDFSWSSATIIATLTVSVVCFIPFVLWEEWVPIFPMRLSKHRVIACLLATGFFTGFPFMTALFNLPQRFQTVNQLSATATGIRLFRLLLSSAFATALVGAILKNVGKEDTRVLWYLVVFGAVLQFIGIALLGIALGMQQEVSPQQYVYQSVLGCGVGFILSSLVIACRVEVSEVDMAVVMGHMRTLGQKRFEIIRTVYTDGYALQMKPMIAFAGAAVGTSLGVWKREWKIMEGLG